MKPFLFYLFAGLAVVSALCVVFLNKPTRALLSLIVTMFSLAVLFLLLGAYFLSMVHLIVYAGAVLVLFLFVIMLQGVGASDTPLWERFGIFHIAFGTFISVALLGLLTALVKNATPAGQPGSAGTVEAIGHALFQDYLLPLELTSLLLLLGVFAAVALAKEEA